jgi:hypothetical protein
MRNLIHRNHRRKLCGEKVSYLTREDACFVMGALARATEGRNLNVYFHALCDGWHVGHTPRALRVKFGLESPCLKSR